MDAEFGLIRTFRLRIERSIFHGHRGTDPFCSIPHNFQFFIHVSNYLRISTIRTSISTVDTISRTQNGQDGRNQAVTKTKQNIFSYIANNCNQRSQKPMDARVP